MKQRFLLACLALGGATAQAVTLDDEGRFQFTGFFQLTGGKVLSGEAQGQKSWSYQNFNCPCTIQNWEYVGVYEKGRGLQLDKESLVGGQLNAKLTNSVSATAQLVARPQNNHSADYMPTLDWAYVSWKPAEDFTLQLGRKRIPLYYYSDYLYIGYAYPWVRPAPDVYGWPIFSYDGVTGLYTHALGNSDWTLNASVWRGRSQDNNSAYWNNIYYGTKVSTKWDNITGTWASLSNGIVEGRVMFMNHQETTVQLPGTASETVLSDHQSTRIRGVSFNVDYQNYILRSELNQFKQRPGAANKFIYNYFLVGAGYKLGQFTPMFTTSRYMTKPSEGSSREGRFTRSASVRWDFAKNLALKVQYDDSKDKSQYSYPFFGDSKLLSVSLQGVF